jgi:large subunit ribosomal protein L15
MKLHDLRPADGSRQPRMRVGRGIAAGKGKTAGRGTKGQKARAGGSIPPWFEGGQTPLHMRIPKLRGFKNRFKIVYEVVNIGAIASLAERGAFEADTTTKKVAKATPITINQDILRAVGLVRTLNKPLKILGAGELSVALFVVADAFTASATAKIEAAGGTASVLEVPAEARPALGLEEAGKQAREPRTAAGRAAAGRKVDARVARAADAAESAAEAAATEAAKAARATKAPKASKSSKPQETSDDAGAPASQGTVETSDGAAATEDAKTDADDGDA